MIQRARLRTRLGSLITLLLMTVGSAQAATPTLRLADRIDPSWTRSVAPSNQAEALALQLSDDVGDSILRELVLIAGHDLLGTQYIFGANRDDAVDCSSLVQRIFRSAGIELPRTSRELVAIGEPVLHGDYAPGDLLFYRWGRSGLHVAVYLEDDRILHASTSQREVVVSALTPAWDQRMVAARRVL